MDFVGRKKFAQGRIALPAEAQGLPSPMMARQFDVGPFEAQGKLEAPTPVATIYEVASIRAFRDDDFQLLASVYKQLNATLGSFGQETLRVSTKAPASGDASDDSDYERLENQLSALTTQRDSIADEIRTALDGAEFKG